jgi:hypothetical protein
VVPLVRRQRRPTARLFAQTKLERDYIEKSVSLTTPDRPFFHKECIASKTVFGSQSVKMASLEITGDAMIRKER